MSEDLPMGIQPRIGCWFLVLPIALAVVLLVGYGALLLFGARGRPATGPVATLTFTGCPEAQEVVAARVEQMGLGDPVFTETEEGFTLTARLPDDPRVIDRIPDTLARTGHFEVRDGAAVIASGVQEATVRLDLSGSPVASVQLGPEDTRVLAEHMKANPEGEIQLWLDDQRVGGRKNDPPDEIGRLDLSGDLSHVDRITLAAEQAVILGSGPLPCPVEVTR